MSERGNSGCESDGEARLVVDCDDSDRTSPNSKPSGDVQNVHLKSSQQTIVEHVCMTRSKTRLLARLSRVDRTAADNEASSEHTRTDTEENAPCSDVTNKMYEDSVVRDDGHQGECSAVDAEEGERQTGEVGSTAMGPGVNVSYRLWKLRKDEGHADDWKEGFLKGDHSNREIKVLVRCKVDGCEVNV
jgi:hypothetical protein